jgi:hypothetical protein
VKQALLRGLQALRECLVRHLLWPALPDRQALAGPHPVLRGQPDPPESAVRSDQLEFLGFRALPEYLAYRESRAFLEKPQRPQARQGPRE